MKIKLVSTYPPTRCGIAEHAKQLADALKKAGIEPEIIEIKDQTSSNPFHFINIARKAAKGTSKEDIIHIQFHIGIFGKCLGKFVGIYIIPFLAWLKMLTKAKIVMALHDSPSKYYAMDGGKKEKLLFYYYKFIYVFLKLFVDQFITHSKNGERINIEEWKIDKDKIVTLPLGLPTNMKRLDEEKCKDKLGYHGKKVLILLGYIRGSKNYDMVLEAIKKLDQNTILLIIGKVQLAKDQIVYDRIVKKIDELQIKDRVKLLGFVPDEQMPLFLNAADVGINLHTQGGGDFLSSTMAMQLAYQVPTLSADIPSFVILKKEEGCIDTFKEDDSVDLVKKINELLDSPSKTKYLKVQSEKYWKKNNWDEIGKRTKELYLKLSGK